jgi:hypothetical protein
MKRLLLVAFLPAVSLAVYSSAIFGNNQWRLPVDNCGRIAYDPTQGGESPGQWRGHNYVFGAGPWFGCVVHGDTVCVHGYDPNSGGGMFFPALTRYQEEEPLNPADRFYAWWRDWPPPLERFPDAPQEPVSQLDLWCGYSASDPTRKLLGGPLGLDIQQTLYCFDYPLAGDIVFARYEIINAGDQVLRDCFFGLCVDPDIGDHVDDMTGFWLERRFAAGDESIVVRNAGFAYDYDNREYGLQGDSWIPGAVAVKLLYPSDRLGLWAFKRFTIDINPRTERERYVTMAGYDYRTMEFAPYDSIDVAPADKRFLIVAAPFELAPGAARDVWFAMIGSPYGTWGQSPYERDPTDLVRRCAWAQGIFDERFAGVVEQGGSAVSESPLLYPNPFRTTLHLNWAMAGPGHVDLRVLDVAGRTVRNLYRGTMAGGRHAFRWDGADNAGRRVAHGIYFLRLDTGSERLTRAAVLVR